jgi:hypothetical protein
MRDGAGEKRAAQARGTLRPGLDCEERKVYLFPLTDTIEGVALSHRVLPNGPFRLATRSALVVCIGFVACAIPFFSAILGILGALSVTPTTFVMPCILWLYLGPGGRGRGWWKTAGELRDWTWWAAVVALMLSTLVMVLGTLGAIDQFVTASGRTAASSEERCVTERESVT